jgi:hypothetical protein
MDLAQHAAIGIELENAHAQQLVVADVAHIDGEGPAVLAFLQPGSCRTGGDGASLELAWVADAARSDSGAM